MIDPTTIYQRTHAGSEEIRQKSHGLTQSERLVLIMVDGVCSCQEIRAKLPVLTDDRFNLALHKLQRKELVLEVFLPVEGQAPDELDRVIIDRFLQQDALDPVTIIFQDPEEALGMMPPTPAARKASSPVVPELKHEVASTPATKPKQLVQQQAVCAIDEQYAYLADALSVEVRAQQAKRAEQQRLAALARPVESIPVKPVPDSSNSYVHWGWLLIVAGSFFILGFTLGRLGF